MPKLVSKTKKNTRTIVFSRTKNDNFGVQLIDDDKESIYLFTIMFTDNVGEELREEMVRSIVGHLETAEELTITGDLE